MNLSRIAPDRKGRSHSRRAVTEHSQFVPPSEENPRGRELTLREQIDRDYASVRSVSPSPSPSPSPQRGHITASTRWWADQRAANRPNPLTTRKIDGVYNGFHSNDLTVHLDLDVQDDLDDSLEEFSRLCRFGDFASASQFFAANLQSYLSNPYVLVHYAEMLVQQGEYQSIMRLDDSPVQHLNSQMTGQEEGSILRDYWELLKVLAASYRPGYPRERFQAVRGVVGDLSNRMRTLQRVTSSTEIKLLVLLLRLSRRPHIELDRYELRDEIRVCFDRAFYKRLYQSLLRGGRIWDLYDLLSGMLHLQDVPDILYDIFDVRGVRDCLRLLMSDWQSVIPGTYDSCTTLALLEILALFAYEALDSPTSLDTVARDILEESVPIAQSVVENDPESMRSRPYLRWILVKAQFADRQGSNAVEPRMLDNMRTSEGVVYYPRRLGLPQYVPSGAENPGWKTADAGTDITGPVNLTLRAASEMDDYRTQVLALQALIMMTSNPVLEFETLCHLQKVTQGDYTGYIGTLVSKYLVSDGSDSRRKLKEDIAEQAFAASAGDYLTTDTSWIVNMLLSALEREGSRAQAALQAADHYYDLVHSKLAREITTKMPGCGMQVDLRKALRLRAEVDQAQQEQEEGREDDTGAHEARQARLDGHDSQPQHDDGGSDGSTHMSDDFNLIVKPKLLKGRKVTIAFENVNGPTDRHELSYQQATNADAPPLDGDSQGYESSHCEQGNRIYLRPQRDGTTMEGKTVHTVPCQRGRSLPSHSSDDSVYSESQTSSDSSYNSISRTKRSHSFQEEPFSPFPTPDDRGPATSGEVMQPEQSQADIMPRKRKGQYRYKPVWLGVPTHSDRDSDNDVGELEKDVYHSDSIQGSPKPQNGMAELENKKATMDSNIDSTRTKLENKASSRFDTYDEAGHERSGPERLAYRGTLRPRRSPDVAVDGKPRPREEEHESVHSGSTRTRHKAAPRLSSSPIDANGRTREVEWTASPARHDTTSAANAEDILVQPSTPPRGNEQPGRESATSENNKGTPSHKKKKKKKVHIKRGPKPADQVDPLRGISDLGNVENEGKAGVGSSLPADTLEMPRDLEQKVTPNDDSIQPIRRRSTFPTVESVEDFGENQPPDGGL